MTAQRSRERSLELIDKLKGHERTDPYHIVRLREEILRDGCQRDPITIDAKTNVILDGHHRAEIFKAMNLSLIAVHRVDYNSPDILVRTWVPMVNVEAQAIVKELGSNSEADPTDNTSTITLVWNEGERKLSGTREQVMNSIVGKFPIVYVRDESEARTLVRLGKAKAFLVLPVVTKEDVIRSALSGNKMPPKTTRHVFARKPRPVFVPLHDLSR